MFSLDNNEEEKKREEWYAPIGEYLVLFSNLEFSSREWINFLVESGAIAREMNNTWAFQRRTECLVNVIAEFDASEIKKKRWVSLWKKAINLSKTRNVIAHNPPFSNFDMELDEKKGKIEITAKVEEICQLNRPVEAPGSGLSLEYLINQNRELISIIIKLDNEHLSEMLKDDFGRKTHFV